MSETISKLVIEIDGKEYEFSGSGTPAPDSVGTEQIKDGAVEEQDLSDGVKEKITKTYYEEDEALHMDYEDAQSAAAGEGESEGDGAEL